MKKIKMVTFVLLAVMTLLACGCDEVTQKPTQDTHGSGESGHIIITEVVSKNNTVIADEDGQYCDYIELYNPTSSRLPLKGYYLSDSDKNPKKWEMPNIYIEAGQYLVIFASGKDRSTGDHYHTSFSISAAEGEPITLLAPDGSYASKVDIGPCNLSDVSYGLVQEGDKAGSYAWFAQPTPGAQNTGNNAATIDELQFDTVGICINEFITKNETVIYDKDGDYSDFIEIYNPGSQAVDLSGMYLSDDLADPTKWEFPTGSVIEAGGYLLIFASGKDKNDGELHADFKLSETDSGIILSDNRQRRIDSVTMVTLPDNVSYGLKEGIWMYFPNPTPAKENNTPAFEDI